MELVHVQSGCFLSVATTLTAGGGSARLLSPETCVQYAWAAQPSGKSGSADWASVSATLAPATFVVVDGSEGSGDASGGSRGERAVSEMALSRGEPLEVTRAQLASRLIALCSGCGAQRLLRVHAGYAEQRCTFCGAEEAEDAVATTHTQHAESETGVGDSEGAGTPGQGDAKRHRGRRHTRRLQARGLNASDGEAAPGGQVLAHKTKSRTGAWHAQRQRTSFYACCFFVCAQLRRREHVCCLNRRFWTSDFGVQTRSSHQII